MINFKNAFELIQSDESKKAQSCFNGQIYIMTAFTVTDYLRDYVYWKKNIKHDKSEISEAEIMLIRNEFNDVNGLNLGKDRIRIYSSGPENFLYPLLNKHIPMGLLASSWEVSDKEKN